MSRSRCLLHKSKLDDFKEWLQSLGWKVEGVKSCYEVLRMRHSEHGVLIIYQKSGAKEHCTTFGIGNRLVYTWLNLKK